MKEEFLNVVNFHPEDAPTKFCVYASYAMCKTLMADTGVEDIHTYQMSLLNNAWEEGRTVRIWYQGSENYEYREFKHGTVLPGGKVLREAHNLQRLWQSGALGKELTRRYQ